MSRAVLSRLATFAILLALLGGAWALYGWAAREEAATRPAPTTGPLYPGVSPDAVDYLYLHLGQGQDLELERAPSGIWRIIAPTDEVARHDWVEAFVRELLAAEGQRIEHLGDVVPTTGAGLEPPRYRVTVGIGERRDTLLLGERDPMGRWVYARRPGGDVFLATVSITTRLDHHAEAWVEQALLRGLRGRITHVRVDRPDGLLLDAVREGERWVLRGPVAGLADSERIAQLVRSLEFVDQERVIASRPLPSQLAAFGLPTRAEAAEGQHGDATRIEIGAEGEGSVWALLGAGWQQAGDWVAAVREDYGKIVGVPRPSLNLLTNGPEFFREHGLLPPVRERAESLRLERDGRVVLDIARGDNGGWTFAAPEHLAGRAVESGRVFGSSALGELLGELDALEAVGFVPPPQGEPIARIAVGSLLAGQPHVDRVDLFAADAAGRVPARTSERPAEGLLLPPEVWDLFDPSRAELLRGLAPLSVDPRRWARLEITVPGRTRPLVLARREGEDVAAGSGTWAGDDPGGRAFGLAHDMLRGFRGLQWRAARPGAEHPYRIAFLGAGGEPLGVVALRRPAEGEDDVVLGLPAAYAAIDGAEGVELAVQRELLDRFDALSDRPGEP